MLLRYFKFSHPDQAEVIKALERASESELIAAAEEVRAELAEEWGLSTPDDIEVNQHIPVQLV